MPQGKVYEAKSPIVIDLPSGPWTVRNASGEGGEGYINLATATQNSVNVVYAQLMMDVGAENAVAMANRLGVRAELPPVPSLVLGAGEVSPLDMASAYQTFANNGVHCEPFAVTKVVARGRPASATASCSIERAASASAPSTPTSPPS